MEKFFYYFGIFNFFFYILISIWILFIIFRESIEQRIKNYQDQCFLHNLGMNEKEFDNWMHKVRMNMSSDEYKNWAKKNVKWYFHYIKVKKPKGKNENK